MSRLILFIFLGLYAVTESYSKIVSVSDSDVRNFMTYNHSVILDYLPNGSLRKISEDATTAIDCLGLGSTVAKLLNWWFANPDNNANEIEVKFLLSSRNQRYRVRVMPGSQFGLEWADFKIERRTVFIVHGFLSHSEEAWVREMEDAFLLWVSILYNH